MKKIAASNPYSFYYFEDSIIDLNIKGHPGLEQFYKNLLIRFKDRVLPKFCNYNSKLPCIVHSDYVIPKKANFKDYLDFTSEGKDVMYLQALVRIDLKLGSIQSLKFIDSLRVCPNKNILKTKIIQYIIYEKFAQIS